MRAANRRVQLLACALGSVANPYEAFPIQAGNPPKDSRVPSQNDRKEAERYYHLARRRIGLIGRGIRASQCHFLAGVYLMYTMRPLSAWQEFHSATQAIQVYLKASQCQEITPSPGSRNSAGSLKKRRMEQRLYWSCYKSECELRVEMDIPNSLLADFQYPDLYPSPPDALSPSETVRTPGSINLRISAFQNTRSQEQCWFYYLTEITLRRIGNRVLNLFYQTGPSSWSEEMLPRMASIAREFEQQLQDWYVPFDRSNRNSNLILRSRHNHLPEPIRYEEDEMPSEELPYMVWGRALEIKAWIYRPFLFYAVHSSTDDPGRRIAAPFVAKALNCSYHLLSKRSISHRHHGTWYELRQAVSGVLLLVGAAKCGTLGLPPEWPSAVQAGMARLRYWEHEVPGVTRALGVLERFLKQVTHL